MIKKRFLKIAVLVFLSISVFGSISWFFYYQKRHHDLLEGAKKNGVLYWNQNEIENENGYILITAFGVGCSLIKKKEMAPLSQGS